MGKKRPSLLFQLNQILISKDRIGKSRHEDKIEGTANKYIYSYSTMNLYKRLGKYFINYIKKNQKEIKYLDGAKEYVPNYIMYLKNKNQSNWTIKTTMSALCKIYDDLNFENIYEKIQENYFPNKEVNDVKKLFMKSRDFIVRSRFEDVGDTYEKNEENLKIEKFARATGLRRKELQHIQPEWITKTEQGVEIWLPSSREARELSINCGCTKGGRGRRFLVLEKNEDFVLKIKNEAKEGKPIFSKVPKSMDVHSRRADFCMEIIEEISRPISKIEKKRCYLTKNQIILEYNIKDGPPRSLRPGEIDLPMVYTCQGGIYGKESALFGRKFDRKAIIEASHRLGHKHYHTTISYVR